MIEQLSTWLIAVPVGAILGWIGTKLFSPTFDALGNTLLDKLTQFFKRDQIAHAEYLELERLLMENHGTNTHNVFRQRKTYLRDKQIADFFRKHGTFMRHAIKNSWIEEFDIHSYNQSDVFFAGLELLFDQLKKDDIQKIYQKHKDNDQVSMWPFFEFIDGKKPKLLSTEVVEYLRAKQEEWAARNNKE